jgi:hypothetical protein
MLLFTSCDDIKEFRNTPEQKAEINKFMRDFYNRLIKQEYEKSLGSIDLKSVSSDEVLRKYHVTDSILGKLISYKQSDIEAYSKIQNDKTIIYEVKVSYNVNYDKGKAIDNIELSKINDSLKITFYNTKINL